MKLLNLILIGILFVTSYSAESDSGGQQSSSDSDSTSVCGPSAVSNYQVRESQAKVQERKKVRQSQASGVGDVQSPQQNPTP